VEDCPDFRVAVVGIDLLLGQSDEFMTVVMDPTIFFRSVDDMFSAVVIRLDGKRFLFLVFRNLVIIHGDLQITPGDSPFHDDRPQCVDRLAGIEDIIHQEYFVPGAEELRGIGPAIDHHFGLVTEEAITACDHSGIEDRSSMLPEPHHLVILGKDVGHVRAATQACVNDIRNESIILVHVMDKLQRVVPDHIAADEFFFHTSLRINRSP
jgi:hypothetical protein